MKSSDATEPLTDLPERRSESREPAKDCYNAEIKMLGYPIYQVKIADVSPTGASIVVKEDSSLLRLLTVGRVLDVRFHSDDQDRPDTVIQFEAEVRHISEVAAGRYKGHRLVGIQRLENNHGDQRSAIKRELSEATMSGLAVGENGYSND